MALPDVPDTYRLILKQTWTGQEIVNVFFYRDTALVAFDPQDLAQAWWDAIKATWRAFVPNTSAVLFQQVDVEQLFDDHAFGTYAVPVGESLGTRAGGGSDLVTPIIAGLIKLNVATRVTRPGSKRISGFLETDLVGQAVAGGTVTLLQNLANIMDDDITPTGTLGSCSPVIVGYPTSLQPGEPRVQDVVSATASIYASHQVSRDTRP